MNILNNHNKELIDNTFPNLLYEHKQIIVDSLNEICDIIFKTIFKQANEDLFIKQMKLNNSKDILGFVILLLPYFSLTKENCLFLKTLDYIFKDTNSKTIIYKENIFKSTYYLDHNTIDYNINDYKKYFYNNTQKIIITIHKIKHKLLPN